MHGTSSLPEPNSASTISSRVQVFVTHKGFDWQELPEQFPGFGGKEVGSLEVKLNLEHLTGGKVVTGANTRDERGGVRPEIKKSFCSHRLGNFDLHFCRACRVGVPGRKGVVDVLRPNPQHDGRSYVLCTNGREFGLDRKHEAGAVWACFNKL